MSSSSSSVLSLAARPVTFIYPKLWFNKVPEPVRFVTSAGLGNIIFFYIDIIMYDLVIYPLSIRDFSKDIDNIGWKALHSLLPHQKMIQKNKESISFFISYLIQIIAQHFLNAFFVYGLDSISTKEKYLSSLTVTYSSYFISLVGSTICNLALSRRGMSKNVAFWGTIFGFGLLNFFLLKILIGRQQKKYEHDGKKNDGKSAKGRGIKPAGNRNYYRNNNQNSIRRGAGNAASKRMRGGAQVQVVGSKVEGLNYGKKKIFGPLIDKLVGGAKLVLEGKKNSHMAFVQSIGSVIINE